MSSAQDRAARHEQKRIDPLADVTITQIGDSTGGGPDNPTARR